MGNAKNSINTRTLFGLLLIFIGGIYLLSTLDVININTSDIIFSFPFFILLLGAIIVINSHNKAFGLLLVFIGSIFLIPRIFPSIHYSSDIIFPVIIITIGIYILLKRPLNWAFYQNKFKKKVTDDNIDEIAIFGGGNKVFHTENFKGGNVTAVFGGFEIDLTQCKLAEGENVLDVFLMFGGVTFYIPKDWNIRVNVTPVFGGFSNKLKKEPGTAFDNTRTLIIKGVAVFGGGEIKPVYR